MGSLHVIICHEDVKEFWLIGHFEFILAPCFGLLLKNLQSRVTEHMSQSGESCIRVLPEIFSLFCLTYGRKGQRY